MRGFRISAPSVCSRNKLGGRRQSEFWPSYEKDLPLTPENRGTLLGQIAYLLKLREKINRLVSGSVGK